ncbi:MAG: hypothetical protein ABW190_09965 [Rhizobacter sp.]
MRTVLNFMVASLWWRGQDIPRVFSSPAFAGCGGVLQRASVSADALFEAPQAGFFLCSAGQWGSALKAHKAHLENFMKKQMITALAALFVAGTAFAQVGEAVKETGKATAETAKQGAENAKAAVSGQPEKTVHKAKAKGHKVKAKHHRENAKDAAKEATN